VVSHDRVSRGAALGGGLVRIVVIDNQIDPALKALKKQMLKDGLFQEMKRRAHYEKPSVKRKRKQALARKKRRRALQRSRSRDTD
jgi:small subunit ribosomal protein S21